jgi:hypothetical protein
MASFDEMEDKWWVERPEIYASYNELPSKAKWLVRQAPDESAHSQTWLEVYVDQERHLLPASYIAPLMLLSIQELSSLAETFSPTANSRKKTELWRNIHFIWQLRESILSAPGQEELEGHRGHGYHPILQRWTIRFIHGISNAKSGRKKEAEKLGGLYAAHREAGELDKGVLSLFSSIRQILTSVVLLEWVLAKEALLVITAQRIVTVVLSGHIRSVCYAEEGQFARKMITDIIDHLRVTVDKFVAKPRSSQDPQPKRPRGRPKTKDTSQPPEDNLVEGRITRGMKAASRSGLSGLLEGPSFTTSPIKSAQKVDQLCFNLTLTNAE